MKLALALLVPCTLFFLSDVSMVYGQLADFSSEVNAIEQKLGDGNLETFRNPSRAESSQKGFTPCSYGPGATLSASGNLKSVFMPSSYSQLSDVGKSPTADLMETVQAMDMLSQAGVSTEAAAGIISSNAQNVSANGLHPSNMMNTQSAKGKKQGFAASKYGLGTQVSIVALAQNMGSFSAEQGQFFPELSYQGTSGVLDAAGTYTGASLLNSANFQTNPLEAASQSIILDAITQSNPYSPVAQANPFSTSTSATTSLITNTQSTPSGTTTSSSPLTSSSLFGSTSATSTKGKQPQKRTWP